MEYRGEQYSVLQSLETMWKGSVEDLEGFTKSSFAPNRIAGIKAAERAIDKALAPKKRRLVPPG
jgi:hypothetical protein